MKNYQQVKNYDLPEYVSALAWLKAREAAVKAELKRRRDEV